MYNFISLILIFSELQRILSVLSLNHIQLKVNILQKSTVCPMSLSLISKYTYQIFNRIRQWVVDHFQVASRRHSFHDCIVDMRQRYCRVMVPIVTEPSCDIVRTKCSTDWNFISYPCKISFALKQGFLCEISNIITLVRN